MSKRRKNDFYPTPAWATEILLKYVDISTEYILEPCSGNNDIVNVLNQNEGCTVITNDIDSNTKALFNHDATKSDIYELTQPTMVITNPPFNQAFEILKTAREHVYTVALLLRLSFLEPTNQRGKFLKQYPPNQIIVLPRISFTGDGKTDSVTCAWMIWKWDWEKDYEPKIHIETKDK